METVKNTVTIDIKDYNELRDFKNAIVNAQSVIINTGTYSGNYNANYNASGNYSFVSGMGTMYNSSTQYTVVSESEAVEKIALVNEKLNKDNDALNEIIFNLNKRPRELTSAQIKDMSIFEFIKWRKI